MLNRRKFIRSSAMISLAPVVPSFLASLAHATEMPQGDGRFLVVIQLDGGNDGINTVVPLADEGCKQHRHQLRLPDSELIKVNGDFALHARLRSICQLLEQDRLSIVHGVGYPNPNRSHFESMKFWHVGSNQQEQVEQGNGWIGDSFGTGPVRSGSPHAVHVGDESMPLALCGRRCISTTISNPADMRLRASTVVSPETSSPSDATGLNQFVTKVVTQAYTSSRQISELAKQDSSVRYPESRLAGRLKLISDMIKSDLGAQVYYTLQPGYDTHAGQLGSHGDLLGELSSSLNAFTDDLRQSGLEDRVLVLCFSEFGRRVAENDSLGTDHGTAGPVFLAGTRLANRSYGVLPSLTDLDDGDLKFHVDFRHIYGSILTEWLGLRLPSWLKGYRLVNLLT
ncbi:MAG: DUF1501 domain-containing protein [Pirellulales bacterium]